jgi:protein-S-isoprenylcysteine O-methyltransferase Ste14
MSVGHAVPRSRIDLEELVGSGDRIGLFALPFLILGVGLNAMSPEWFTVGGPPAALSAISISVLAIGIVLWMWSVVLILTHVPRGQLITTGPYRLMKHPIYTSVALLVLPWLGFLLDTWLGALIGIVVYAGTRKFAPREEASMAARFGSAWDRYRSRVWLWWL